MPREEDEDANMEEVDGDEEDEEVDDPANYFTQPTREEREALRAEYRSLYEVEGVLENDSTRNMDFLFARVLKGTGH